eukprot:CAMPEP_0206628090 /NCGR_PEP_ID=MMETSP0325_2-20121206/66328_1 /ASSEMBLY_ACC=CAM_ASM_000347 /TAXON_ID=2866 /ORGANISM="Crypthecodinium cohnii, Strain Seligo" /LENGTH=94 /DNA_ID=CAMNT_0054152807 /DNA_START=26 /DNA_END=310 /DNA_ORIENTATION=-
MSQSSETWVGVGSKFDLGHTDTQTHTDITSARQSGLTTGQPGSRPTMPLSAPARREQWVDFVHFFQVGAADQNDHEPEKKRQTLSGPMGHSERV